MDDLIGWGLAGSGLGNGEADAVGAEVNGCEGGVVGVLFHRMIRCGDVEEGPGDKGREVVRIDE